jgi:tRNA-2-methylthio-N6-dimethylallyladenosine synthase
MPKKVFIRTFGCQMNDHDSERMAGLLREEGYTLTPNADEADLILVNTCSIRDKAEHKAYSELGRYAALKKDNAGLIIGMTGCVAQQEGEKVFRRYPWVDLTLGSANIPNLPGLLQRRKAGELHVLGIETPPGPPPTTPAVRTDRVRAWVTIMEGCDKHCAYCVVPGTRGPERSRPADEIVREVQGLAENGYKEVTLLGQTVNSYGRGTETEFPDLLRRLHEIPGILRIRFFTSHPTDLTSGLIDAISDLPRVCNHLHLPLQSGSDTVLARMKRTYTASDYLEKIGRLRKRVPGIGLTTDIIVGFPGETDADFAQTLDTVESVRYDSIFAFKYSARPHTESFSFQDSVDEGTKNRRLQELLALQRKVSEENNLRLLGTVQEVLVEAVSARTHDHLIGRTGTNRTVRLEGSPSFIGSLLKTRIDRATASGMQGEILYSVS